jgi:hypothetical protein
MITDPVFIVGAPRSGTSLLFHVLRTSQDFWSLPSEGFHIWNSVCHPSLRKWSSEECHDPGVLSETEKENIRMFYERQSMPAWFWRYLVNPGRIWRFNTKNSQKTMRRLQGEIYIDLAKAIYHLNPVRRIIKRRLLDKSLNNCLRLELVKSTFPGARFIYLQRHGLESIRSLINGWLNPYRFVTFQPPYSINIAGYNREEWKFVMPDGWREFDGRHLVELCTWQWRRCHECILAFRDKNPALFTEIKFEDLISNPGRELKKLAGFIDVPFQKFASFLRDELPEINRTPDEKIQDFPFPDYLPAVRREIAPVMELLHYE